MSEQTLNKRHIFLAKQIRICQMYASQHQKAINEAKRDQIIDSIEEEILQAEWWLSKAAEYQRQMTNLT